MERRGEMERRNGEKESREKKENEEDKHDKNANLSQASTFH